MRTSSSTAGDPDLDTLLEDLRKVREETAVAAVRTDARRHTCMPSFDQQLTGKEFTSFIQGVELSDVVHVPTSLTSYEPESLKSRSRNNSLISDDIFQDIQQMNNNVFKHGRLLSLQPSKHYNVHQRSSISTTRSPSHVCDYYTNKEFL